MIYQITLDQVKHLDVNSSFNQDSEISVTKLFSHTQIP